MIKITKTKIEVDLPEFKKELKSFTEKYIKYNPYVFAITLKCLNEHFETKIKSIEFYELSDSLGLKVWNGKGWYVKDILNQN